MAATEHKPGHGHGDGGGYEIRDTHVRPLVWITISIILLVVVTAAVVWLMLAGYDRFVRSRAAQAPSLRPQGQVRLPPNPRLQVDPAGDMARFRAEEKAILTSYAWENETSGIVRIPVERAMEIVLEKGFPVAADAGTTGVPSATGNQRMWDSSGGQRGK
jgi:uncharacterized iron-regulated membrane protein